MSDDTANLILEDMRRFERGLGDIRSDLHDVGDELHGVNRRIANLEEGMVLVNRRLDQIDERTTRIERRLDLVEP